MNDDASVIQNMKKKISLLIKPTNRRKCMWFGSTISLLIYKNNWLTEFILEEGSGNISMNATQADVTKGTKLL